MHGTMVVFKLPEIQTSEGIRTRIKLCQCGAFSPLRLTKAMVTREVETNRTSIGRIRVPFHRDERSVICVDAPIMRPGIAEPGSAQDVTLNE